MKYSQTQKMIITALGICLVFVATILIKIPNGFQGYVNMGDGMLLALATIVDPIFAFCIGAFGSALADLASGYAGYALFTFFIKGIEAYLISYLLKNKKRIQFCFLISILWMILGYMIADSFINQSLWLAILAMPFNIAQGIIGIILAKLMIPILKKIYTKED